MMSNLIYGIKDKPPVLKTLVFAFQQLLAILAATIAVPAIVNNQDVIALKMADSPMSASAALFGAGIGTLVYLLFTKFKSPVFLGSSFAFLGSMASAFAGAMTVGIGYLGLIIGALIAGLAYVVLGLIVKKVGTAWISKLMPPVIIGPTVAIIGLSLAGNAVKDLFGGNGAMTMDIRTTCCLICGLVTLITTIMISVHAKKMLKMIPFIIGIVAGYLLAGIITIIGQLLGNHDLIIVDFSMFKSMEWIPNFAFIKAFASIKDFNNFGEFGGYLLTILVAYLPVAFVVFAEHIADHKNLSSIIGSDLLTDPGLDRTLMGDGVGSFAGAFFGGCPNTTYGESVGCVAISGNASVITIVVTALIAIVISFFGPFITFLATIPSCVMGGICIALYGFIAVSGLKMIQGVDLNDNKNLFVVSMILITGVGGMTLNFINGSGNIVVTVREVACALILGIIVNALVNIGNKKKQEPEVIEEQAEEKEEE